MVKPAFLRLGSYGPINDRILLRALKENGMTMKEIVNQVDAFWSEKEINRMIEEIDQIDEYLKAMGRPNDYDHISKKDS